MNIEHSEADLTVAQQLKEQTISSLNFRQRSVSSMSKEISIAKEEAQDLYETTEKSIQHLPDEEFTELSDVYFSVAYEPVDELQDKYKSAIEHYYWSIKQLESLKDTFSCSKDQAMIDCYIQEIKNTEQYYIRNERQVV